jgi:YesN/AraC family two-component response regulator
MKVLLVDDSSTTARQLDQMVAQIPGFEVVGNAKNGAEAVRLYQEIGRAHV